MRNKGDLVRAGIILAAGALFFYMAVIVARSPLGWVISSAHGGEAEVTWTKPERNCDGTLINDLAGFKLYYGQNVITVNDPTAAKITASALTPGMWWFAVSAYNSMGQESNFSGPGTKLIEPADFKVSVATAYTVVKKTDGFLLLPVGTVPIGTQCISTHSVNGHYAVPRAAVTWSGTVKPDVVVAKCQ